MAEVDAAGDVTKSYGYRPGSTWTSDPLFMKVGGQYYFYQNDHLGTPQKLTAVNGAVVWSAKYSSFGGADINASSSITNNLRFAGQYCDSETGLHYNYFRYYDPKIGRYSSTDPIRFKGGDKTLFAYVLNNPVHFVDPFGLKYAEQYAVAGAIAGGTIVAAGSVVADVATAGLNILATPAEITAGAAIGGAIGYSVGSILDWMMSDEKDWHDDVDYDDWPVGQEYFYPKPPDPEEEKRKKAEDDCFDECVDEMSGDRCSQGIPFTNCMKRCMGALGFSYP